jgi:flagellar hook-basal body complex protein FliE
MAEKLARGENVELHEVMIASQKASITLAATMEIRNKVIEAYQEVMRMQI